MVSACVPLGHKLNDNPIQVQRAALEPWIDRLGFECKDGEDTLVDPPEWFVTRDAVEGPVISS